MLKSWMCEADSQNTCKECLQAIPVGARRCSYCGSSQNWTRHLDIGNTSIALALGGVGLLTVFLSTATKLYDVYKDQTTPSIVASVRSISSDSISFTIANNEERALLYSFHGCVGDLAINQTDLARQSLQNREDGIVNGVPEYEISEQAILLSTEPSFGVIAAQTMVNQIAKIDLSISSSWQEGIDMSSHEGITKPALICAFSYSNSGNTKDQVTVLTEVSPSAYDDETVEQFLTQLSTIGN